MIKINLKILITVLPFLLSTPSLFSGDYKGNGGDILVCENNQSPHLLSLDEFESIMRYKKELPKSKPNLSDIELAKNYILSIKKYSPYRYQSYLEKINSFYRDSFFINNRLGNILDSGTFKIPKNCSLEQIINQNPTLLPPNKTYIINKKLWNQINNRTRASLILHEIIYQELQSKTSEQARYYNTLIMTNSLDLWDFTSYLNLLRHLGFKSNYIKPLLVSLRHELEYHPNGQLKSALPHKGSSINYLNQVLYLANFRVSFYPNHTPKNICSKNKILYPLQGIQFNIICHKENSNLYDTEFWDNQNVKLGVVEAKDFHYGPYLVHLGYINRFLKTFSYVSFHKNANIKKINNAYIEFLYDDNYLTSTPQGVSFHSNKKVKSFYLLHGAELTTLTGKKYFKAGDFVEFDKSGNLL